LRVAGNFYTQPFPIDGKVVLRIPKADKAATEQARQTIRTENDRRGVQREQK
jgi:hypothetical protein